MLNQANKDRIEAAIQTAETGTSGEVVCLLAQEVSAYREVPLAWAAAVALVLPPLAIALGVRPFDLAARAGLWIVSQGRALENDVAWGLVIFAAVQAVLFIAVYLIVHVRAVRRALTPTVLKRHRVARAAHHQFAAFAARAGDSATGVLIFVALEDRQVQVLADGAIHAKAGDAVWTRAADAVGAAMKAGDDPTSGIVAAVALCGTALREHFPADGPHPQQFSNRPMEV